MLRSRNTLIRFLRWVVSNSVAGVASHALKSNLRRLNTCGTADINGNFKTQPTR